MSKTKELVAAGHALAKELHCAESAALVRELATQLDVQLARSNALAAENAGLKNAITAVSKTSEECEINGDELKYVVEPSEFDALTDLLDETPATDAFLAEVRAQGVDMAACALDGVNQFNYANMLDDLAQKTRKGVQS
ncbi:hypothetical protein [Enterobacter cloacae]|uniref:hypothetical protein n=1 Tax=Enterobacter cloacae TaxID=550 RepID=UPI003F472FA7